MLKIMDFNQGFILMQVFVELTPVWVIKTGSVIKVSFDLANRKFILVKLDDNK